MSLLFPVGSCCVAFLLAFGLNWLAQIPWRRSVGKHWTERARALYPALASAGARALVIPFCFGLLSYIITPDNDFVLAGLMSFAGVLLAGFFFLRELHPFLRFKMWLRNLIVSLFLGSLWLRILLITMIFEIPPNFGLSTWLAAGCFLSLILADAFLGIGFHLLTWFRILLPADEALRNLVGEVSQKMGITVRATWILPSWGCNAWALIYTRELVFTDRLLSTLSDEQVKAVCAHELGHLNEPGSVRLMRRAVFFVLFPFIFIRPLLALNNVNILWVLMAGCVVLYSFILVARRMAQRMEKRADEAAIGYQLDASIYAQALARMYEANQLPAVMPRRWLFVAPHPDLYDRMLAAGLTPDFLKPLPPRRRVSLVSLLRRQQSTATG